VVDSICDSTCRARDADLTDALDAEGIHVWIPKLPEFQCRVFGDDPVPRWARPAPPTTPSNPAARADPKPLIVQCRTLAMTP
jgi:DNA-binding transcriptional LysR family regulator